MQNTLKINLFENEAYFTSDLHLGHKNILQYDSRPFKTIEEHDEVIIDNINSIVGENDYLFLLGDFSFNSNKTQSYLSSLDCRNLYFIRGNHDKEGIIKLYERYGTYLGEQKRVKIITPKDEYDIILNHYAMKVWDRSHRGTYHLYGHSHHSLPEDPNSLSFDVGINGWDYYPVSLERVIQKMKTKNFVAIDHHK